MDFFIFQLVLLLFAFQFHSVTARHHHEGDMDGYEEDKEDSDDLSDHCIHIRIDHNTRYTDYLICPYGCCGTLDDQKCCEDPDKDKDKHNEKGNKHLVRGLLIFAGVMLLIAVTCCAFGIYKHKKAKLRKTSPGNAYKVTTPVERMAPYTVFYTARSGLKPNNDSKDRISGMKPSSSNSKGRLGFRQQPELTAPTTDRTSPPRYTERTEAEEGLPPYADPSPPPPYSFRGSSTAPTSTEYRASN